MNKLLVSISIIAFSFSSFAAEISFTMDDPEVAESPLLSTAARNQKILDAFSKHKIKAVLFVCGMRIDNEAGKDLLKSWDKQNHWIANHSYSHLYYHSKKIEFDQYRDDIKKVEPLIKDLKNFVKLFRFPFLKEGNTKEKRDAMRQYLKETGYKQGYVTIDASDWYVDQRLRDRLKVDPKADLKPFRDYYLSHILDRAQYYQSLSKRVLGHDIKHTLLVHHNLLNALFLDDLMAMLKKNKWTLISAKEAFGDPVFQRSADIVPAGESIVWALAKEKDSADRSLRYPGEDGDYEKDKMDKLGL